MNNITETIAQNIAKLRKESGMTQDTLAGKLGVTYQAVSKWENAQACPDIALLPEIAEIFGVSLSSLLGEEDQNRPAEPSAPGIDWDDDGTFRLVFFKGKTPVKEKDFTEEERKFQKKIELVWQGDACDISSAVAVHVEGNVKGNATASNGPISIGGDLDGDAVTSNGAIAVQGDLDGDAVTSNGAITVQGDLAGDAVTSNGSVVVKGDAEGDITIKKGNVTVSGDVDGNITSDINCDTTVTVRGSVMGSVTAHTVKTKQKKSDMTLSEDFSPDDLPDFDGLNDLKEELTDLIEELEDLESEQEDLSGELSDLTDEWAESEEDDKESVWEEIEDKKSEINDIAESIKEKKQEIREKKEEIRDALGQ